MCCLLVWPREAFMHTCCLKLSSIYDFFNIRNILLYYLRGPRGQAKFYTAKFLGTSGQVFFTYFHTTSAGIFWGRPQHIKQNSRYVLGSFTIISTFDVPFGAIFLCKSKPFRSKATSFWSKGFFANSRGRSKN